MVDGVADPARDLWYTGQDEGLMSAGVLSLRRASDTIQALAQAAATGANSADTADFVHYAGQAVTLKASASPVTAPFVANAPSGWQFVPGDVALIESVDWVAGTATLVGIRSDRNQHWVRFEDVPLTAIEPAQNLAMTSARVVGTALTGGNVGDQVFLSGASLLRLVTAEELASLHLTAPEGTITFATVETGATNGFAPGQLQVIALPAYQIESIVSYGTPEFASVLDQIHANDPS